MAISNLTPLIQLLSKSLFEAEYRRLERDITEIDRLNREVQHLQYKGFVYNGTVYIPKDATVLVKGPKPALAYALTGEMQYFLKDQYTINNDKKLIEQILYTLLYQCNDVQEVRDGLPECLVQLVPELSKLQRKLNQTFIIRHDERAFRQFNDILPKIEFYSATRLLY